MSALVKSPPPFAMPAGLCASENPLVGFPELSYVQRQQARLLIDCMLYADTIRGRFATEPRRVGYSKRILSFELAAREFNVLR